jgi:hypothetical protein
MTHVRAFDSIVRPGLESLCHFFLLKRAAEECAHQRFQPTPVGIDAV